MIRFNVTQIVTWAEDRNVCVNVYLTHIMQSAQLLQSNKTSPAFVDAVCAACCDLNSMQVQKILRNYRPSEGDSRVPASVIECVTARAMNTADVAAKDDETVRVHTNATTTQRMCL